MQDDCLCLPFTVLSEGAVRARVFVQELEAHRTLALKEGGVVGERATEPGRMARSQQAFEAGTELKSNSVSHTKG